MIRRGNILRDIYNYGAWSPCPCNIESLGNHTRNLGGILNQEAVLNDRPGNTHHIGFLKRITANFIPGNLARDDNHRNRVHVRSGNTGNGIGSTRTGRHQNGTYFASRTGMAICRMGCSLFMANENMLNIRLLKQCIINMQRSPTGVTPQVLNTGIPKCTNDDFTARQ